MEAGRSRVIRKAMAELPAEQREAIELAYFSGYSQSEIANRNGLPLGTVKTRMRQGMIRLRDLLAPHAEGL
jgi:RNA polymerase sigma-70 factor (ECF subfamily)